jgi:hypothetical protein
MFAHPFFLTPLFYTHDHTPGDPVEILFNSPERRSLFRVPKIIEGQPMPNKPQAFPKPLIFLRRNRAMN